MTYCANVDAGRISRSNSLNMANIRLIRAKNPIRLPAVILFFIIVASLQAAPLPIPKPPSTGARAFIVQDFYSNRIIAEKDSDKSVEPASITKLMTAYSVFKELQSGNISLNCRQ
jgi:D-alanyl-D-alanine carboxypeptidase (penicillin-binding protein 5/6)